jgi:hypothetical protein
MYEEGVQPLRLGSVPPDTSLNDLDSLVQRLQPYLARCSRRSRCTMR